MTLPFDPVDDAHRHWVENGWGEVADGMAAVTSVMRAHQIMLARVEDVLRPHGLTFSRYELLMLLSFSRAGSMPMAKASARLQVHPTSVTNTVDRLEEAGLVRRVPNPADGPRHAGRDHRCRTRSRFGGHRRPERQGVRADRAVALTHPHTGVGVDASAP